MSNTPTSAFGALYDLITVLLDEKTVLRASPQIIDARVQPDSDLNRKYSLDLQTKNTDKYRDRTIQRLGHAVKVSYLIRVNPLRQAESYKESLVIEESVIDAALDQTAIPTARTLYRTTTRTLTLSREYLLVTVLLDIEGDYNFTLP